MKKDFKDIEIIIRDKEMFTINEFAYMTGSSPYTLRYYDKIGLLKPRRSDENGYRYYSQEHFPAMNVIKTCRRLGASIENIGKYISERCPDHAAIMLKEQINKVDAELRDWVKAKSLLNILMSEIESVAGINESSIEIKQLEAKSIILGPVNDYTDGRNAYAELRSFYRYFQKERPEVDIDYPVWGLFSGERIQNEDWCYPSRFYFNNPTGNDLRPAGLYAIGYGRGDYGRADDIYRRILDYIDAEGYKIAGNAYEEYPLNEIAVQEPDKYLIRVLLSVQRTK